MLCLPLTIGNFNFFFGMTLWINFTSNSRTSLCMHNIWKILLWFEQKAVFWLVNALKFFSSNQMCPINDLLIEFSFTLLTAQCRKIKNYCHLQKIRQINSLVRPLLSRNFCRKSVTVNFSQWCGNCKNPLSHFFLQKFRESIGFTIARNY